MSMPEDPKEPLKQEQTPEIIKPMPNISSSSDTSWATVTKGQASQSKSTIPLTTQHQLQSLTTPQLQTLYKQLVIDYEQLKVIYSQLSKSLASGTLMGFMKQVIMWPEEISYVPELPHIQEWVTLVQTHDKLLVEASRDHFKSTFFSFILPLYWCQKVKDPKDAFGIAMFAYSDTQSQKYIKRIRQEIESNPSLRWLLPKAKSHVWDATTLDMSNGCWIESYGFGSSFRGRHPAKVIIDDACKPIGSGAISLEQQIDFFAGTIIPAVKKKGIGQLIVTGNPVDKIDFLEWLERNNAFTFKKYPVLNAKDEPLAPRHYDRAAIEDKRNSIPAHYFAREYMLHRVSSADARFKEEWIVYYEPSEIEDQPLYKVMTIDPAMSPVGDALACVVTGTSAKDITYVLDCMLFRGDLDTGVGRLVDMMVQHQPDYIGFEVFALQAMYKTLLEKEIERRGLYFHIQEVGRDSKKKKAARIESLQPAFSQRKLRFLTEHKALVNQALLWDPISKTNDDDGIDALSWQVPLWRKPFGLDGHAVETEREIKPGTFDAAVEAIKERQMNSDYVARLFADMRYNA